MKIYIENITRKIEIAVMVAVMPLGKEGGWLEVTSWTMVPLLKMGHPSKSNEFLVNNEQVIQREGEKHTGVGVVVVGDVEQGLGRFEGSQVNKTEGGVSEEGINSISWGGGHSERNSGINLQQIMNKVR
jgi:hypothetical protein